MDQQSPIEQEHSDADEQRNSDPWWYSSFAFSVLAGTFGPIATAFSICTLQRPWFLITSADSLPAELTAGLEPIGFVVVNIIQLVVAAVANVVVILGLTGHMRHKIAQLVGVAGYYVSSFCLVAIVATASARAKDRGLTVSDYTWSQSYHYALYAGIMYFILASLLFVNVLGAQFLGYSSQDTAAQSVVLLSLLVNVVVFLSIVLLGALLFSRIEGWDYLDGVYWADVTLLTIGFGDIYPETTLGRALVFPYAILGILFLGITLASIRRLVLDRAELILREKRLGRMRSEFLKKNPGSATISLCEPRHLKSVFAVARNIQKRASRRWRCTSLVSSLAAWLLLLFGGAAVFVECEKRDQGWSYFDGTYMAFVGLTTIGYGDMSPTSSCGRSFFVLWSLLGVPTITIAISNMERPLLRSLRGIKTLAGRITFSRLRGIVRNRAKEFRRGKDDHPSDRLRPRMDQRGVGNDPQKTNPKIPTIPELYCVMVLDEILDIFRHLNQEPLEHYSVEQWLWFGELLGGWSATHPAQSTNSVPMGQDSGRAGRDSVDSRISGTHQGAPTPLGRPSVIKLGQFTAKSPLMGPEEEAQWFLERLACVLRQELLTMMKKRLQQGERDGKFSESL